MIQFEHVNLLQLGVGLLFSGLLWFIARTIKKIDANQSELFSQMKDLSKEVHVLKGEHQARITAAAQCGVKL